MLKWTRQTNDAPTCTNDRHEHLDDHDEHGEPLDHMRPMVCPDCGRPTHYDRAIEDYQHDDPTATCFLHYPRPDASPCTAPASPMVDPLDEPADDSTHVIAPPDAPAAPGLFADGFARHRDDHYSAVVSCDRSLDEEVAVVSIDYTDQGDRVMYRAITLTAWQARLVIDALDADRGGDDEDDRHPIVEALRRLIAAEG